MTAGCSSISKELRDHAFGRISVGVWVIIMSYCSLEALHEICFQGFMNHFVDLKNNNIQVSVEEAFSFFSSRGHESRRIFAVSLPAQELDLPHNCQKSLLKTVMLPAAQPPRQ